MFGIFKTGLQGMIKLQDDTATQTDTNGMHDLLRTLCLLLPSLYLQRKKMC